MWDDIINEYVGSMEDPRFTIHYEHGCENWGFVLTDGDGAPIPEGSWHIWRLCEPGWAHIMKIEDKHDYYLKLLIRRLDLQARWSDKYGAKSWNRKQAVDADEIKERKQAQHQELFDAVQDENSWLMKKAMENFERGHSAPTNPTKDSIISYPNQTNRSRIVRPLDDTEGGLIIPENF